MTIWFDMDGTIADLYGVNGWLDDLQNYNPRPYREAKVMLNMALLARKLNKLQSFGFKIGICSWLSKNSTIKYDKEVAQTKKNWLNKHLPSVHFDKIIIVDYGTPKSNFASEDDFLFDDEEKNRSEWIGIAHSPLEIFTTLDNLLYRYKVVK